MWSGNEEVNEEGQPVRLYHPIQYRRSMSVDDPTASFIGGPPSTKYNCPLPFCQQPLVSLVQLHIPSAQRTYRVWACNSARCFRSLFTTSKFSVGGNGVVVCETIEAQQTTAEPITAASEKVVTVKEHQESVDDWDITDEEEADLSLDDLETKLAAMETDHSKQSSIRPQKLLVPQSQSLEKTIAGNSGKDNSTACRLPVMALASIQEPPAVTAAVDSRDVGLHGMSNQKIQEMLSRYLQEEQDQDIVQMLQGTMRSGGGGGPMEVDEDLTEDEMALLRFSDRLKRFGGQVVRHAHGGEPLWSVPVPTSKRGEEFIVIPPSADGTPRVFEFQILPSLLHVLNVDKHAKQSGTAASKLNDWYNAGGMDFGSIAVYSCPHPDGTGSRQEFVVVQDTAEEQPKAFPDGFQTNVADVVVDESSAALDTGDGDDDFVRDA